MVVLAGDHLDAAAAVGRSSQAVIVQKYFRRIRERAPLLICSGNHDLDHRDSKGVMSTQWIARARHYDVPTDGDSRLIGDTLFTICPWSDGQGPRAGIARLLERDAALRPARWVWLHHAPPAASPTSWDGRKCFGDPVLRGWIERLQPDIVLSGHVHQSPFTRDGSWADRIGDTWVFNAGHQIGPLPSHIVVDTERPGAYWCSLAATEVTPLTARGRPALSRRWSIRRPGSWLWLDRQLRRRDEAPALLVGQRFQHLVDHAQMILAVAILPLQVDQVAGHVLQPARQQPGDRQDQVGVGGEIVGGFSTTCTAAAVTARTLLVCGMSSRAAISPNTAPGSSISAISHVAAKHLEAALGQHEQPPGALALAQQHRPRRQLQPRAAPTVIQQLLRRDDPLRATPNSSWTRCAGTARFALPVPKPAITPRNAICDVQPQDRQIDPGQRRFPRPCGKSNGRGAGTG